MLLLTGDFEQNIAYNPMSRWVRECLLAQCTLYTVQVKSNAKENYSNHIKNYIFWKNVKTKIYVTILLHVQCQCATYERWNIYLKNKYKYVYFVKLKKHPLAALQEKNTITVYKKVGFYCKQCFWQMYCSPQFQM